MSDRFAEFDLAAWTEDDVLVIRTLPRGAGRKAMRRETPWSSHIALSFFGLATIAGLHLSSATSAEGAVVVDHRDVGGDVAMVRAGPGRDVVPSGYWQKLSRVLNTMPALADDDDVDVDDEPFI